MKVTTLGCDFCRDAVRPAVISPVLVVGEPRKGDPTLDLCGPHWRQLRRYFRPVKRTRALRVKGRPKPVTRSAAVEQKRANDKRHYDTKVGPKRKRQRQWQQKGLAMLAGKQSRHQAAIEERETAILAALRKADHRLKRPELDQETGLSMSRLKAALRGLVARRVVTAYGAGPHTRYELASKARQGSEASHAAAG
jgi:hypothetical protein